MTFLLRGRRAPRFGMLATTMLGSSIVAGTLGCATVVRLPPVGAFAPASTESTPRAHFVPSGTPSGTADAMPDPAADAPLTLNALLAYADVHAPVVATARARLGLAEAGQVGADLTFPANPSLGLSAGTRSVGGQTGIDFEVAIQQQLEIAGEQTLRRDAARAERDAADARVDVVRWTVHVEVHRLFVALRMAEERRDQAARFVALSEKLRSIADRQIAAGESSPLILLVADADLAQTREALITIEQSRAAFTVRLAAIIGWPGELPSVMGTLPAVQRSPALADLTQRMLRAHPSIRAAELRVAARNADARLAARDAWLQPTVGFAVGREAAPAPDEKSASLLTISLGLPLPIWQRNQGPKAQAEAAAHVAHRARAQAVAARLGALAQARINLNGAGDRVALYAQGIMPQLAKNLALLERAFDLGEVDVHQVSQTRQRLLAAASRYLAARVDWYAQMTVLEGLVGTRIWPDEVAK